MAFVAEHRGDVCGMVGVSIYRVWHREDPLSRISRLVVDEGMRARGVGSVWLWAAEEWLCAQGGCSLMLTSGLQRTEAHRFYLERGYQLTGQRCAKTL